MTCLPRCRRAPTFAFSGLCVASRRIGHLGRDRNMRSRKLIATMTFVALLGSDFVLAASPALGQAPNPGNGYPMAPTPHMGAPQQRPAQLVPQIQPPTIQRAVGPTGPNVCQPGSGTRPYQTVSIPRSRATEPNPFQQAPQAATVTQVPASQSSPGAQAQVTQQPGVDTRPPSLGLAPVVTE